MTLDNLLLFIFGGVCAAVSGAVMLLSGEMPDVLGSLFLGFAIATTLIGGFFSSLGSGSLRKGAKLVAVSLVIGLASKLFADHLGPWTYVATFMAVVCAAIMINGPPPEPARRLSPMDPRQ